MMIPETKVVFMNGECYLNKVVNLESSISLPKIGPLSSE